MKRLLQTCAAVLALLSAPPTSLAGDWPQWRGPARDGVSREAGLAKEWPQEGPKLRWKVSEIGSGYSTPAVVGDRLYLMGNDGVENEFVRALAVKDGSAVWTTQLGKVGNPKQQPNFPGARSTPTVDGNSIYALSSDGDLACLETATGKIRWQKNVRTEFGGKQGQWAYSESPLVDGDTVVCTPGGSMATLLALDKKTGEVRWKCALPEADEAAYSSAIVFETGGVRQVVQLLSKGLVGVDAKSGKFLWRYGKAVSRYGANIPTPVAAGGMIYTAAAGTGGGAVKINLKDGVFEPEQVYFETKLPTAIGGGVKVGDLLYGTTAKGLVCLDFATGQVKWEDPSVGAASLCVADGRIYLHGENGDVALVEPSPDAYRQKGRFTPSGQPAHPNRMEKAWAYPVVANGSLYVRDQGVLWSYDVGAAK